MDYQFSDSDIYEVEEHEDYISIGGDVNVYELDRQDIKAMALALGLIVVEAS